MGRKGSRYTLKEKLACISLVEQGITPNAVGTQYNIKGEQIQQWVQRYHKDGEAGLKRAWPHRYPTELKLEIVKINCPVAVLSIKPMFRIWILTFC